MHTREASVLDLFVDSTRLMGDSTLCGIIGFNRTLDPERLGRAVHACILAHPVLHSRLVRGNGPAFWEMAEAGSAGPVPVVECDGDYRPLVTGPVDPYGPVQVRLRLLRRNSGDVIVVNLAHAAADASGLQAFMGQLLREYENPGTLRPAEGGIPERDTLWTRTLLREKLLAPEEMDTIDPMWPDPFGRSDAPVSFHRECIAAPELAVIHAYAKSLGGSVNDAILAAYFLAMSDLTGHNGPLPVFFPVNLRRYLSDGSRVMSNQAANVSIPVDRKAGEGMAGILPRIISGTRRLKAGILGVPEQARMDAASDPEGKNVRQMVERMAALEAEGFADIYVTNPGVITLPEVDGLIDAYVCFPGGRMPTTCIITSTFRGRMTITMGYQDSERAREGTRKAVRLFREYLQDTKT
ncbi:MAG: hypothetical protein WC342_05295 [Methanoregula sp.]|jgi:NRPS condensation-like uncharacterized protein